MIQIKIISNTKLLLRLGLVTLGLISTCVAHASAFQIWEQNGAGTGDYHAGGAAIANDASTVFYNPAGLTRLKHTQVVGGAIAIPTKMDFRGTVDVTGTSSDTKSGTGSADGGGFDLSSNVAPFGYLAIPINSQITAGLGVATPFGLSTDYPNDSIAAPYATETSMKNVDFMPSIGIKLNDKLSFGLGADINYLHGEFDNDTEVQFKWPLKTFNGDYRSQNSGQGYGYGLHLGFLFEPTQSTRIGLAYHSQVHYNLKGSSKGFKDGDKVIGNHDLKTSVTFPAFTMLSVYHDFTSKWAGMFSATYTQWDVFRNLELKNVANPVFPSLSPKFDPINIKQHFRDTYNLALGTQYQLNHLWTFKAGMGYDMTPTKNQYRNLRLPDATRVTASLGTHLQVNQHLGFDVGFTRVFFHDTSVNIDDQSIGTIDVSTHGSIHSSANVIGFQMTWTM